MIESNLTPAEFQRKRRGSGLLPKGFLLPREVIIGLIGGFFVLLISLNVFLQVLIVFKWIGHASLTRRWEKVLPERESLTRVEKDLRKRQARIASIQKILGQHDINWSQKLSVMSEAIPRGVWFTRILFEEESFLIQGSAVSKQKMEKINVTKFLTKLKETEDFVKDFKEMDIESIRSRDISGTPISDFVIRADMGTALEKKDAAAKTGKPVKK